MVSYLRVPEPDSVRFSPALLIGARLQDFMVKNLNPGWMLKYLVFAWLACPPAFALDLYSGEVTVADQGVEERLRSVPAALIQVFQKHSGQRELPLHPALDAALLSANRIMTSFYYREHERVSPDGSVKREWRLVANFLPESVDRIVRDLELPRWRAQRKPITIWIVVDDGLGRRLMPLEYDYAWSALTDVAGRRGLPVNWPELNEVQKEEVDLQLLWGGFTDDLVSRERNEDVVIVAARREGPIWNVRWNFAGGEETSAWRNRDMDLAFALVDGMHRLTDLVAARDSIASSGSGNWQSELLVEGFRDASDYARCLAYLESLGIVDEVNVEQVEPGAVHFALELNALPEYLEGEFGRDGVLIKGPGDKQYRLAHSIEPMDLPTGNEQ
jgi:hypothetical protein